MLGEGFVAAIIKGLLGAAADFLLGLFAQKQADENAKDLGRAEAQVEQSKDTIEAQQAELDALANAPRTTSDAIKRLEEGSA